MPSHLVIQSKDRQAGTSSEFRVQIPTFSRQGFVALLSASTPNTLYNIYEKNHYLSWSRGGGDFYLQIPHGAYGISDFLVMLPIQMNTVDSAGGY